MAIVFPSSPNANDTFTAGTITYKWDGAKWISLGVTPTDRLLEGANSLEINASNNLVWTGNNIGIGLTNPDTSLHIKDGSASPMITLENPNNNSGVRATYIRHKFDDGFGGEILCLRPSGGAATDAEISFRVGGLNSANQKMAIKPDGKVSMGGSFTPGATLHVRDSNNTTQGEAQVKISKGIGSGSAPSTISRENLYLHLGGSEWGSGANGSYLIGFGYTNGETGTGIPAYVGFNEDTTSGYTTGSLVFGTRPNNLGDNVGRERMRITEKGVRQYPCANDSSHAYQGIYQQLSGKKQLAGSGNFTDIVKHGHSCSYILQYHLLENDNNSLGGGPGTAYIHVRYGSSGYTNHIHSVAGMNGGSLSSPEIVYVNAGSKLTFRATWSGSNPVFLYWHLSGCGETMLEAL